MEIDQYLKALRRRWHLLTAITAIFIGLAGAASALMPTTYQAESRIYVSVNVTGDVNDLDQGTQYSQEVIRSFAELVNSSSVLVPVIEDLDLGITSSELAEQINVDVQTGTVIIELAVSDTEPQQAAEIARALDESLNEVVQTLTPASEDGDDLITLTTIEEPATPLESESPGLVTFLGLGLVAGVAVGIFVVALRETLDTQIRSENDMVEATNLTVLGRIPFDKKVQKGVLVTQAEPGSRLAECFQTLRNNLQFLDIGHATRSFVITSSVEGEGKTSVAVNLAISLRSAGHKVLLVEADLRRPQVSDRLGIEGAVGLTDVLTDRVELEDVIQKWGPDDLAVLPAGAVPPNPNELLGSEQMRQLMRTLHQDYDIILFDAPPLLPVSDATVLGAFASGALIVAGTGVTHKPQLKGAVEDLQTVGVKVFGLVPTLLPTRGADAGHYERYLGQHSYTTEPRDR